MQSGRTLVKEEKMSDEENSDADDRYAEDERLFLRDPIKAEYSVDFYEYKSNTGFENSKLIVKSKVTEDKHPIKRDKVEEDLLSETFETDVESTRSTSRCLPSSPPVNSVRGTFGGASSDENVIHTHGKSDTAAVPEEKPLTNKNQTKCEPANIEKRLSWSTVSSRLSLESKSTNQSCDSSLNDCTEERDSRELSSTKSNDQNGKFECVECKQRFIRRTHLNEHARTHAVVKPFECDECERKFSLKRYLKAHRKIHAVSREKPFECEECKQKFSRKSHLSDHVRTHTGEKPFQCDQCQEKFSQKCNLKAHQRVHAKLFECRECGQKFLETGHLRDHLRVHTGERPFECEQCGEAYSRVFTLQNHLRTHGVEKPFECDQCHRTFLRKCLLKSHQREHI